MKKFLLTLIASIAFCGSILAQDDVWNPLGLKSYWSDFDYHAYMDQKGFVAAISIDGEIVSVDTPDFEALELAAFVNIGGVEQCRGVVMFLYPGYVEEYGDPYITIDGCAIYYTTPGDELHFKMYDHANGILYTDYTVSWMGESYTEPIVTGEWYVQGWDDPENPLILNFTTPEMPEHVKLIDPIDGDGNYYLVATPVGQRNPSEVGGMLDSDYDLYYFNEAGDDEGKEWVNRKVNDTEINDFDLMPGNGYLYANAAGDDLVFTGFPVTAGSRYDVTLHMTEGAEWAGYNLVGNPFAQEAYLLDGRDFYVMNDLGTDLIQGSGAIEAMGGAIVVAENDEEILTFTTVDPAKGSMVSVNLMNSRGVIDRATVRFGEGRMLPKFQLNSNHTKLYIPVDDAEYAVVLSEGMGEIPVNFKAERSGSYSLSVSAEEVSFSYLHLIDNKTGADVDLLATPSYSFEASSSDYASRFRLVFTTGVTEDSFAFFSNGSLVVNNEGEATVQLIDVNGRILSSENINGSASVKVAAAAGVYMVRLINGESVRVQKVVVR